MGRDPFCTLHVYIYFIDKTSSSCDCTNNNLVEIWPSRVIFCSLSPTISCSKFYTTTSCNSYHIFYFLSTKKPFCLHGYWSASSSRQLSHLVRAHMNFRPIFSPSLKDAVPILRINFYRISL